MTEDDFIKLNMVKPPTDEDIVSLKQDLGLWFATSQLGVSWVSTDMGETWKLKKEILDNLAEEYSKTIEQIDNEYFQKRKEASEAYFKLVNNEQT